MTMDNDPTDDRTYDSTLYVQQAVALLGLPVPPAQLPTVIEEFERVRAIAQTVLDWPLPDDLEAAPRFEP